MPEQIVDAYAANVKSCWPRNGDDPALAKNLACWLEGERGLRAYAGEPIPPDMLDAEGGPLDMVELAQADEFAKLWRRVETRWSVIRSLLHVGGHDPETEVAKACEEDELNGRYLAACKERHGYCLQLVELFRSPGCGYADARENIVAEGLSPYGKGMPA